MSDLWSSLLRCLEPTPAPPAARPGAEAPADVRVFEGPNLELGYYRLYGGQLLGQFLRAAARTCPDKAVKSLHTVFAREGTEEEPVRYEVTRHHEGRTFGTLTIVARQSRGVLATASVSVHATEGGPERQADVPVPPLPGPEHSLSVGLFPWETRSAGDLDARAAAAPEFDLWMRTPRASADLAPAIAAYATDLNLIGTALLPLDGVSQQDAREAFASAVTAHTMWFHRPFRTDSWLLLHQHSPILAHGRCFGRGDVLTEDGVLVASYAQEALLRFRG
ncbi:acyl-CoA thioesterase [Actinomadura algeriensis]|uniref:Acyl-CoA thioesterase-2 n=1 Tax=Actinomadura algeriensis TaxID=1679523 RepID=A0ABR9K3F2_9ACTN|nr:acyl-CoA thioesterase domain-containing protein [Actinomadura algeriensis]MBE1536865.1 acyl-CoA thioesterase-2 [Actinomadura algeriensis]